MGGSVSVSFHGILHPICCLMDGLGTLCPLPNSMLQ
jgi:hypothetical protein